ncbi:MAG TPA: RAMP superfamily CRISPR-associated protein, partial [Candidatus Angelobacter sp.]|nr:RAMP superfamily CRISPR-associated protein [Candidatus Angelobacter sp.]
MRPRAPWATSWRADSLFGAISWRWVELFPESFFTMLDEFHTGSKPPFVLSDAFPGDCLPLPFHVAPQFPQDGKKRKPPFFISQTSFRNSIQQGSDQTGEPIVKPFRAHSRLQTSIDRDTGAAAEGQLFETEITTLEGRFTEISIYFRTEQYREQLLACFQALAITGFGKKSSTGLGAFEIIGEAEACPWLDDYSGANAFVSLSHFVPNT